MKHHLGTIAFAVCFLSISTPVPATEDKPGTPATSGSESVLVNGKPAKRAGDIPGAVGSPDVLINGQSAIVGCKEGTPILSPNVFINGKPKVLGCTE